MSWKKNFARNIRFNDLPNIGAFKIENEPEPQGKGKFKAVLTLKSGEKAMLTTYEGTIGDILACEPWCEAYTEKVGKDTYVRFRSVK